MTETELEECSDDPQAESISPDGDLASSEESSSDEVFLSTSLNQIFTKPRGSTVDCSSV